MTSLAAVGELGDNHKQVSKTECNAWKALIINNSFRVPRPSNFERAHIEHNNDDNNT